MRESLKPTVLSALVLAFASLGDAFLYAVLPIYALQLNVPLAWIGFLLSVNRVVRLFSNYFFASLFTRYGFKIITICTAFCAMVSTAVYSLTPAIIVWIIARVVWGMSYSALLISASSYALQYKKKGFSLGLNRSLQETGPVIALAVAPLLLYWLSPAFIFFILSVFSFSAVFISMALPHLKMEKIPCGTGLSIYPSAFNLLSFLLSFFIQGILIVSISKILSTGSLPGSFLAGSAGLLLAYRRICAVIISPFAGVLADKKGMHVVFSISLIFILAGLMCISSGYSITGILVVFSFYSVVQAIAPGIAISYSKNPVKALAAYNTWSDLGAATGTMLAGILLLQDSYTAHVYLIAIFILCIACIPYFKKIFFYSNDTLSWK